jgi:hypothetical protein
VTGRRPASRGRVGGRRQGGRRTGGYPRTPNVWSAGPSHGSARPAVAVLTLVVCAVLLALGLWAHLAGVCVTSLCGIGGAGLYLAGRARGGMQQRGR